MSKLVLIRHGESQWNLENRFTGWVDVPLSAKGIEEAKAAGKKLAGFTFDRAFSSVLARANETLRYILEAIGQTNIPVEKDKALNERMYGELQGLNKAETAKKFGDEQVLVWRRSYDTPPPALEPTDQGVSTKEIRSVRKSVPLNWVRRLWPMVSAVMPVPSET